MRLSKIIHESGNAFKILKIRIDITYNPDNNSIDDDYEIYAESLMYINNGENKCLIETDITMFFGDNNIMWVELENIVKGIDWREIYRHEIGEGKESL